ncbi:MAG TPA: Fur family transcriptional regulator [Anaerolineales bacterium]|jgi:Fe2+ or Zn2+ uptake regulation protein
MSCTEQVSNQIRSRGFRLTPQRLTILQALRHSGKHLTPAEVYAFARQNLPGLTEATVYRTLEFLSENGLVMATHLRSGKLVYQVSEHDHHHLTCQKCGSEVEVSHAQLAELYNDIERSTGYRLTTNHLTFFGLCPQCQ